MQFLPLFIILALIAEILGTVGGFGSSMFFVPIAGYFFDFHSVLGITALFHLSSNVSKIALFRKGFDKKLVLTIGIPAILFVIAGAFLSRFVNGSLLQIILSIFLIVLSLLLMVYKNLQLKPTTTNSIAGGALSGLTTGLLGTGGAIRGLTLAAFNLDKERFIATSAIIDLGIDLSRSIVYFSNGYMHKHDYYLIPILLVVGITGTFIGKKLLTRFSEIQFKYAVLILVVVTGTMTLINSLKHI
ncbi:sulfite exporter TauE/SafE family protein [Fluviicola sp.]|uniref:sulfite exporter TauE/SafE family protein n=1 Tax=Fluviicola sp. TaxID=1917219 RepID=UPI002632867F|nr:sulfite exporter TauE/SafE family protein [Fluviicola sp.]